MFSIVMLQIEEITASLPPVCVFVYVCVYITCRILPEVIIFFFIFLRPHFKPLSDILEDSDSSPDTPVKKFINSRFRRESSDSSILQSSPRLYRSFSTQPTSKFRVNPYPTNGVCVNNQTFLSSLTSSLSRVPDTSNSPKFNTSFTADGPKAAWTNGPIDNVLLQNSPLLRNQSASNSHGIITSPKLSPSLNEQRGIVSTSPFHGQSSTAIAAGLGNGIPQSISLVQTHAASPTSNRLPPTGPSSAVYQLNFPLLKGKSSGTPPSKGHVNRRLSNSGDSSKDHRNGHKRNNTTITSLKNGVPNVPQAHFRQAISAGANQALNVTRYIPH